MEADPIKRVCLIVPCLNEKDVLPDFFRRIEALSEAMSGCTLETLYVDDGSRDGTAAVLAARAAGDPYCRVIILSRNFGHQAAITAGLDACNADVAVILDADLQDPPELVPRIVEAVANGADVVHMVRAQRPGDSWAKRSSARLFYWYMERWGLHTLPKDSGDFKGLSRRAVRALRQYPERIRFVRGMVVELGFPAVEIPYVRDSRQAGHSKYPLRKILRFAMDAVLSYSPLPMWIVLSIGAASVAAALPVLLMVGFSAMGLLAFLIVLYSGLLLMALGLVGEYLVRIFIEVKQRPLYHVKEYLNGTAPPAADDQEPALSAAPGDQAGRNWS